MTAPIRIGRLRPGLWDYNCFPCGLEFWTTSHAEALFCALAHLTARHPRPLPSGMAEPEPGCTCDPYGAAQSPDHTTKGTEA